MYYFFSPAIRGYASATGVIASIIASTERLQNIIWRREHATSCRVFYLSWKIGKPNLTGDLNHVEVIGGKRQVHNAR